MEVTWLNALDERGESPMSRALKCGHLAVGDLVLTHSRLANTDAADDMAPLQWAAQHGVEDMVRQYLRWGSDPNETDLWGETPLHKAARNGHLEVARELVSHGANPEAADNYGMTPLHWVALNGREEVAEFLLDVGAEVNAREWFAGGLTAFMLARLMGYERLAVYLARHGGTC